MRCDLCHSEFDFVSTRVLEPGRADLLNFYGGIVGRLTSTRTHSTAKCISCIDEPEAGRAEIRSGNA